MPRPWPMTWAPGGDLDLMARYTPHNQTLRENSLPALEDALQIS